MKYFYEPPENWAPMYGKLYICDHSVYQQCTLFQIREKGIAVIQQRFDILSKRCWWGPIDPWLANDIYLNRNFLKYFYQNAEDSKDGLYPTRTVRQIMWALRMKPLQKEEWEEWF